MMRVAGAFSKQAREPIVSTMIVSGHRMAHINPHTTQIIDLVSGNVISGNSGDGVRLFAFGNANQTATLHSNLGVDPHNTITSNGTNLSSNGGVHQSVTP